MNQTVFNVLAKAVFIKLHIIKIKSIKFFNLF